MIKTLAVFLFITGVFIFGMSYHNIDLAVNAMNGTVDTNGFGYIQTPAQMYTNGLSGLGISAVMMMAGFAALFGVKDGMAQLHNEP